MKLVLPVVEAIRRNDLRVTAGFAFGDRVQGFPGDRSGELVELLLQFALPDFPCLFRPGLLRGLFGRLGPRVLDQLIELEDDPDRSLGRDAYERDPGCGVASALTGTVKDQVPGDNPGSDQAQEDQ